MEEVEKGKAGKDRKYCQQVEEMALKRIRAKHGQDAKDAKRKAKRPKLAVQEDDDSDDDAEDFGQW